MTKSVGKRTWRDVLKFSPAKVSQSTVRGHYEQYRREMDLPFHCDEESCVFHTQPLVWNGKTLPLILDHKNGVRRDNRPENLHYLCPNCDSQQPTRGGGNKGRVREVTQGGYVIADRNRDGKLDYTLVAETGQYSVSGGSVESGVSQASSRDMSAQPSLVADAPKTARR